MTYTLEQEEIFDTCIGQMNKGEFAAIVAPAGSGKTFVLSELAKQMPKEKILYLAYNRAIKEEAKHKFPQNTHITTTHGLAYSFLNLDSSIVREKDYTAIDIAEMFNVEFETANLALIAFNDFCNSSKKGFSRSDYNKFPEIKIAYELFKKMKNREIQITHTFYLKEFQLLISEKLPFSYDVVLLDEAQDSNEVTIEIFNAFKNAKKIFVGDPNQAIYSFRNCVNAFEKINSNYTLPLVDCYRCNKEVIEQANFFLGNFKKNHTLIRSKQKDEMPVNPVKATITRTNAKIIELLSKDKNNDYVLLKKPKEIFYNSIQFVNFLKGRKKQIDYEVFAFLKKCKNENDLKKYLEQSGSIELQSAFRIAKIYGDRIFHIYTKAKLNYAEKKKKENIHYLITAHTSKVLEFDIVELTNDFPDLFSLKEKKLNGEESDKNLDEEVNLYYVAITRAKFELIDDTKNKEYFHV